MQVVDRLMHAFGDFERVAGGGADDAHADAAFAIGAQHGFVRGGSQRHAGHVTDGDIGAEFEVFEGFGCDHRGGCPHVDGLAAAFQIAGGHVKGHVAKGAGHVGEGQAAAGQFQLVDIDAKDRLAVAIDLQVGHAGDRDQAVFDLIAHQLGQILRAARVRGDGDPHHRIGIGVGLDDLRLVRVIGQVIGNPRDGIAGVVGGHVEIDAVGEFQRDAAASVAGLGRDGAHARHAAHGAFDAAGQFLIHGFRRGPREVGGHGDDGAVHIGQFAHFNAE